MCPVWDTCRAPPHLRRQCSGWRDDAPPREWMGDRTRAVRLTHCRALVCFSSPMLPAFFNGIWLQLAACGLGTQSPVPTSRWSPHPWPVRTPCPSCVALDQRGSRAEDDLRPGPGHPSIWPRGAVLVAGSAHSPVRAAHTCRPHVVRIAPYGISFGSTTACDERNDCRYRCRRWPVRLRL
jgi:hypothetical protein